MKMELRNEVREFAEQMEMKLCEHDDDRGDSWKNEPLQFFKDRLIQEMDELLKELDSPNPHVTRSTKEAADVANFCMMLSWRLKEDWINKVADHMEKAGIDPPGAYSR
jgi:hypothetical protein